MNAVAKSLMLLTLSAGVLIATGANPRSTVQAQTADHGSGTTTAGESTQAKIARALSAGSDDVAKGARIVDTDAQGRVTVLREGDNGFTCMPGNPRVVGEPPLCGGRGVAAMVRGLQGTQAEADQHCARHYVHARGRHAEERFRSL